MKKIALVLALLTVLFSSPAAEVRARPQPAIVGARLGVDTDPYSLINEVNALRAANGLAPYAVNSILMGVAQAHASYMAATGIVSHTGAGGTTSSQRIQAAGYPLAGDLSLGGMKSENITAGSNKSVQQAVIDWQGDAPHLNTMLSANLQEIGAGVAVVGDYVYYVIDCARPTSSGLPQAYTPAPGTTAVSGEVDAGPLVSTIVPNTPNAEGQLIHTVRPGETLWLIAITYKVKIAEIRRLNNMAEADAIYPGEKLLVKQDIPPLYSAETPTVLAEAVPGVDFLAPTAALTLLPTLLPFPSVTLLPTLVPTPTPALVAPVSSDSSRLVLGAIVAAALVLAAIFVRAGLRRET